MSAPAAIQGRPRILDAFCGAGGAGMGYSLAGFDVVGVDIKAQPRYPFPFIQSDALDYIAAHGHEYDAIHASPPCQAYSVLKSLSAKKHPDLLPATRTALEGTGRPWVIENVPGAPIRSGVQLCGTMFGLRVYRHRWFETGMLLMQPPHPKHVAKCDGKKRRSHYLNGGFVTVTGDVGSWAGVAMGIDWMTGNELSQAIPPAYTKYIGAELMAAIQGRTGTADLVETGWLGDEYREDRA